jgi:hypothetical protein
MGKLQVAFADWKVNPDPSRNDTADATEFVPGIEDDMSRIVLDDAGALEDSRADLFRLLGKPSL